jgi:tetratricopeptide (TPR) repeat protein
MGLPISVAVVAWRRFPQGPGEDAMSIRGKRCSITSSIARLALLVLLVVVATPALGAGTTPRREDFSDLVVLHVAGSWREMGRQQVELLGPIAREVFDFNRADYAREIAGAGLLARAFDAIGVPIVTRWFAGDASGMGEQLAGMAEALGVPAREFLRASFALDSGSTVFVATRSATADGAALIGRNVDWGDAGGRRRPVVTHFHPTNGDLAHIAAAWPLLTLPVVGLNEAGFALSMNFFATEPLLEPWRGEWPHRRALQLARNVEDGIRIFTETRKLAFACFMAMADASGAIALVECRPRGGCAVYRPADDWFAHANHARTASMLAHDRYRSPDSFARQAGMEAALRRHLGALAPAAATEVLRDRTGHRFPNATSVGNLFVLNAALVEPAAGILWHATTMQPIAPFGAYHAFSLVRDPGALAPLPASPQLEDPAFRRELEAISLARLAIQKQREAESERDAGARIEGFEAARALWEALAGEVPPRLDPARVAVGLAHALHGAGNLAGAFEALAPAEDPSAPFDARAHGLASRALLADRLGRRDEALRIWRATLAHLDAGPEFNIFEAQRALARAGLAKPQTAEVLPIEWWDLGIPR